MMIKKLVLKIIRGYQIFIRPGLKLLGFWGDCRFLPSCSVYTYQSIERYGILKGIMLGCQRIIRCQPYVNWGVDPQIKETF